MWQIIHRMEFSDYYTIKISGTTFSCKRPIMSLMFLWTLQLCRSFWERSRGSWQSVAEQHVFIMTGGAVIHPVDFQQDLDCFGVERQLSAFWHYINKREGGGGNVSGIWISSLKKSHYRSVPLTYTSAPPIRSPSHHLWRGERSFQHAKAEPVWRTRISILNRKAFYWVWDLPQCVPPLGAHLKEFYPTVGRCRREVWGGRGGGGIQVRKSHYLLHTTTQRLTLSSAKSWADFDLLSRPSPPTGGLAGHSEPTHVANGHEGLMFPSPWEPLRP